MMETKIPGGRFAALASLALALGTVSPLADAAMAAVAPTLSVLGIDAVANPGGQASPQFQFTFNTDFDLAGFELTIDFDPTKLSFNAASSTLTAGGDTYTLAQTLAMMEAASKVPGPGPDFFYSPGQGGFTSAITSGTFTFTGTYLTQSYPLPAGSSVTLTGVFQAQPGFAAGSTLVHVSGQALDASFTGQSFAATAAVAAVPEPEAWLMLLGGLGLVAARVRRRSA